VYVIGQIVGKILYKNFCVVFLNEQIPYGSLLWCILSLRLAVYDVKCNMVQHKLIKLAHTELLKRLTRQTRSVLTTLREVFLCLPCQTW